MPVASVVVHNRQVRRMTGLHETVDQGVDQLDWCPGPSEAADHHRHAVFNTTHRFAKRRDSLVHTNSSWTGPTPSKARKYPPTIFKPVVVLRHKPGRSVP